MPLDGLEFCYEDGHSQLFGKRGGKLGGDEFLLGKLDIRIKTFEANVCRHAARGNSPRVLSTCRFVG